MEKKVNINGVELKIFFVKSEQLSDEYNKKNTTKLFGLFQPMSLNIYIDKDMHLYQIRKTLVHEMTHALISIKNELIGHIAEIDFHEMFSVFISENIKELVLIDMQVNEIMEELEKDSV